MKFRLAVLLLALLTFPVNVFAKSGPPIPARGLSISEAINIANEYFYNEETRIIDGDFFKKSDYILISARYTNRFGVDETYDKEWAWEIIFIHPVQNDHSVVYKVTNDRKLIFLYGSE